MDSIRLSLLPVILGLGFAGEARVLAGETRIRVATFNASLFRPAEGQLVEELGLPMTDGRTKDPRSVAEIIQRIDPDIILLNEFDYDAGGEALERFHSRFLGEGWNGQAPVDFPYRFTAESNTGIASCFDLNNSGGAAVKTPMASGYGEDAFGFGQFPGQYGMAVLSKYPILRDQVRSFQRFLWKDMPGAKLPDRSITPAPQDWYSEEELEVFRLSSKSHWDLPIDVDGQLVHLLVAHPTPPTFDGSEDRNGLRNHDEIRLWADFISPGGGGYLYDDDGGAGGLGKPARFVICGDYNADPTAGDSVDHAIRQLLDNSAVNGSFTPRGSSGTSNTSAFGLRVDYVLPSAAGFCPLDGAIFWPIGDEDGADLVGASDHRLVWMDLELTPMIADTVSALAIRTDGADVVLSWDGVDGILYAVESSLDLGAWGSEDPASIVVVDGSATFRDEGAALVPGRKFYRVTVEFLE